MAAWAKMMELSVAIQVAAAVMVAMRVLVATVVVERVTCTDSR